MFEFEFATNLCIGIANQSSL